MKTKTDKFLEQFLSFLTWLFSLKPLEKSVIDPADKLLNSMRITARCRFNASVRLQRQSNFSFFTTTILSLGLIFIPLVQNSDISLAFTPKALNMLQIFLAVAVLVYSVINSTARYEVRSQALNECGDKIKELIRNLRTDMKQPSASVSTIGLSKYHEQYNLISTDSENHSRVDFALASLEMKEDYCITGIPRIYHQLRAFFTYGIPYIVPCVFIAFEAIFILDMLRITEILTPYLKPSG
ncbi:SLATT domain-containing protein [Shewanella oncorhynchi]|uniref:SLATT domain-containing protein n=1 Tax=Shewanella oncorhynchi TaxID=2726434 RepID=UPI0039EF697B